MKQKSSIFNRLVAKSAVFFKGDDLMKQTARAAEKVSATQTIALGIGTSEFEDQLFSGNPDCDMMGDLPLPRISEKAEKVLGDILQKFSALTDDWKIRHSNEQDISEEAWQFAKDNLLFSVEIPEEYGGLGLSAYEHSVLVSKLATHSIPAALTVMVPNSLGPGKLLDEYGTQEQKDYYLPRLAIGEETPFFGLTEPTAGSDAFNGKTKGIVFRDKETGEAKIKINGEKRYITLAGDRGTLGGLSLDLEDPGNILGKGTNPGITCVLVKRGTEGFDVGKRHNPMNVAFQNGPLFMEDMVVSADDIIGGSKMAGEGALMLMKCLGKGRGISLPATATAAGIRTAYAVGAYTKIRKQFGYSLSDMKAIQSRLATIAGNTYMLKAASTVMACRIDNGENPSLGSAIVKAHTTEAMAEIIDAGMRVEGGKAIQQGSRNLMGQLSSAQYIARTVEGDNIMTKALMIFAQGLNKAHNYIPDELTAAAAGDTREYKNVLTNHIQDVLDNRDVARKMGKKGQGGNVPEFATEDTADSYRKMNRMSAAFNYAANVTSGILQAKLQVEQNASERLGDVYGNLEMAQSALWYFHKVQKSQKEFLPLARWVVEKKLHEAEEALEDLIDNFPMKEGLKKDILQRELEKTIFPEGRKYKKPSDKLQEQVAATITEPGAVRDWLKDNMLIPDDPANAVRHIGDAFDFITKNEIPVLKALEKEVNDREAFKNLMALPTDEFIKEVENRNVLTKSDIKTLKEAAKYRAEVIEVDYYNNTEDMKAGISANPLKPH